MYLIQTPSRRPCPLWGFSHFSADNSPCGFPIEVSPNLSRSLWKPDNPTVVIVPGRRPPTAQPGWVRIMALLVCPLHSLASISCFLLIFNREVCNESGSSLEMFHLIGFGVGAHVAGVAGRCLHGAVGRITGLDPFAPVFSETDKPVSLNYTDAQYVDVVHTNFNGEVILLPVGHVDFYIGNGHQHPGCPQALAHGEQYLLCSHHRAFQLFTSSIQAPCKFIALPCESVSDFRRALCTRCNLSELGVCPQLGKGNLKKKNKKKKHRPIRFKQVTAILDISAAAPYCGQDTSISSDCLQCTLAL
uniref:Phospholipase A1 member A n=1 Tax=Myripristis murdjan TaxID=586833 RepID=A0A667X3G3_9TELE